MLTGIEQLRQFKIFAELDEEDFESIGRISHIREVEIAEQLTSEGAEADYLYLFVKGGAVVKMREADGHQSVIDELGPGEILGWGAVVEPHVYTASAWATKLSEVIVVDARRLRELCERDRRIGYQVAKGIGEVISKRFGQAVGGRGGEAITGRRTNDLRQFKPFAELDEAQLETIAKISRVEEFDRGVELIREGAAADQLYLFLKGSAEVKVRDSEGQQVLIDELGPGELLGWGAVMEPHVYAASAWTTEASQVIVINGKDLRDLCDQNKDLGYGVLKGVGEVMSHRFGHAVGGHGVSELHRFKIFAGLDMADLDLIGRISHVDELGAGVELTAEGAPADQLYLLLRGRVAVKVRSPEGRDLMIDELGPGDVLGWSAVTKPYIYTASGWTTEPSEVIVVDGEGLRRVCEENKRLGYQVIRGIGEVISRRFGRAAGGRGELLEKDLRAFSGEERVLWDGGQVQLTTRAVLIGMSSGSPEVIPLEALYDVDVVGDCVVFHVHGEDVCSPPVEEPERLAALTKDALQRSRYAHRRTDYLQGFD